MPLCTLHLLSLQPTTPLQTFLSILKSSAINPLVISRVIRWIILPSKLSTPQLLAQNVHWDLLLILPTTESLPPSLQAHVQHHWHITAGVPSRLTQGFASKNAELLNPQPGSVPKLSPQSSLNATESSQNLELSAELDRWIDSFVKTEGKEAGGAVSMFNLLAFNEGMKEEYLKYGAAFAKTIGSRHGGNAKIVGNVVPSPSSGGKNSNLNEGGVDAGGDGWNEIALAHYPSISHFRDMLSSKDYQEVNHKHRVPSLKDTAILMTSEVGIGEWVEGEKAKL